MLDDDADDTGLGLGEALPEADAEAEAVDEPDCVSLVVWSALALPLADAV